VSEPTPHDPKSLVGQIIGQYRIVAFLGAGGMAEVYVGEHTDPELGRRVAIKALLPEYCRRPAIVDRFMNEARALGRIRHPGVVDIYEVDQLPDGRVCLVMELLRGETLGAHVARRGRLPPAEAAAIAIQIASAMHAAHSERIIHRDLKPDNVFVQSEADGLHVRVLDFGVAKLLDGAGPVYTATKTTLGTAVYMAPEQFRSSRDVDARADVYALGCVLFEMLTAQPPYPARTVVEQMRSHAFDPVPSAAQIAGVPAALDGVLTRMLAKSRDDRYGSMVEVIEALSAAVGVASGFDADGATEVSDPPEMEATRGESAQVTAATPRGGGSSWWPLIVVLIAVGAAVAGALALR